MIRGWRLALVTTRCVHTAAAVPKSHYDTLGVPRSATSKQIKAAYFDLAKKCHPDVNPIAESKDLFQEISQAYQVLSDESLRMEYNACFDDEEITFKSDAYRDESPESVFKSAFGVNFDEMFSKRFGYTAEKDNIREYILGLSLMEAVMGSAKYIEINTHQRCVPCQGYGAAEGAPKIRVNCGRCYGGGQIPVENPCDISWMKLPHDTREVPQFATCGDCLGRGYIISKPCSNCMGKGKVDVIQWHPVSVPPGVKHGQVLNCPGIDGAPMLITIHIMQSPDSLFEYDDEDNVQSCIQVHYSTLIQGGHVSVYTIDNENHTLYIPPNTQPGTLLDLEDFTPTHVYNVKLFLPNAANLTSYLDRTYRDLLEEEERHVTTSDVPYTVNYCKTVQLNSLTKFELVRNDLYSYIVIPFYRLFIYWPLSGLYSWARQTKRLGGLMKSVEAARGHTFHYPRNRKDVF